MHEHLWNDVRNGPIVRALIRYANHRSRKARSRYHLVARPRANGARLGVYVRLTAAARGEQNRQHRDLHYREQAIQRARAEGRAEGANGHGAPLAGPSGHLPTVERFS